MFINDHYTVCSYNISENEINITMPYYPNKLFYINIYDYNELYILRKLLDLCIGLKEIHDKGIYHCNISPNNIFYHNNKYLYSDAYQRLLLPINQYHSHSLYYLSPEVLISNKYDQSSDIWSLGCVFYYILTNELLFTGCIKKIYSQQKNISLKLSSFPEFIKEIIMKMIDIKKEKRYNINQIINEIQNKINIINIPENVTYDDINSFSDEKMDFFLSKLSTKNYDVLVNSICNNKKILKKVISYYISSNSIKLGSLLLKSFFINNTIKYDILDNITNYNILCDILVNISKENDEYILSNIKEEFILYFPYDSDEINFSYNISDFIWKGVMPSVLFLYGEESVKLLCDYLKNIKKLSSFPFQIDLDKNNEYIISLLRSKESIEKIELYNGNSYNIINNYLLLLTTMNIKSLYLFNISTSVKGLSNIFINLMNLPELIDLKISIETLENLEVNQFVRMPELFKLKSFEFKSPCLNEPCFKFFFEDLGTFINLKHLILSSIKYNII